MPAILLQLCWFLVVVGLVGFAVHLFRQNVTMEGSIAKVFDAGVLVFCGVAVVVLIYLLLSWIAGIAGAPPPLVRSP